MPPISASETMLREQAFVAVPLSGSNSGKIGYIPMIIKDCGNNMITNGDDLNAKSKIYRGNESFVNGSPLPDNISPCERFKKVNMFKDIPSPSSMLNKKKTVSDHVLCGGRTTLPGKVLKIDVWAKNNVNFHNESYNSFGHVPLLKIPSATKHVSVKPAKAEENLSRNDYKSITVDVSYSNKPATTNINSTKSASKPPLPVSASSNSQFKDMHSAVIKEVINSGKEKLKQISINDASNKSIQNTIKTKSNDNLKTITENKTSSKFKSNSKKAVGHAAKKYNNQQQVISGESSKTSMAGTSKQSNSSSSHRNVSHPIGTTVEKSVKIAKSKSKDLVNKVSRSNSSVINEKLNSKKSQQSIVSKGNNSLDRTPLVVIDEMETPKNINIFMDSEMEMIIKNSVKSIDEFASEKISFKNEDDNSQKSNDKIGSLSIDEITKDLNYQKSVSFSTVELKNINEPISKSIHNSTSHRPSVISPNVSNENRVVMSKELKTSHTDSNLKGPNGSQIRKNSPDDSNYIKNLSENVIRTIESATSNFIATRNNVKTESDIMNSESNFINDKASDILKMDEDQTELSNFITTKGGIVTDFDNESDTNYIVGNKNSIVKKSQETSEASKVSRKESPLKTVVENDLDDNDSNFIKSSSTIVDQQSSMIGSDFVKSQILKTVKDSYISVFDLPEMISSKTKQHHFDSGNVEDKLVDESLEKDGGKELMISGKTISSGGNATSSSLDDGSILSSTSKRTMTADEARQVRSIKSDLIPQQLIEIIKAAESRDKIPVVEISNDDQLLAKKDDDNGNDDVVKSKESKVYINIPFATSKEGLNSESDISSSLVSDCTTPTTTSSCLLSKKYDKVCVCRLLPEDKSNANTMFIPKQRLYISDHSLVMENSACMENNSTLSTMSQSTPTCSNTSFNAKTHSGSKRMMESNHSITMERLLENYIRHMCDENPNEKICKVSKDAKEIRKYVMPDNNDGKKTFNLNKVCENLFDNDSQTDEMDRGQDSGEALKLVKNNLVENIDEQTTTTTTIADETSATKTVGYSSSILVTKDFIEKSNNKSGGAPQSNKVNLDDNSILIDSKKSGEGDVGTGIVEEKPISGNKIPGKVVIDKEVATLSSLDSKYIDEKSVVSEFSTNKSKSVSSDNKKVISGAQKYNDFDVICQQPQPVKENKTDENVDKNQQLEDKNSIDKIDKDVVKESGVGSSVRDREEIATLKSNYRESSSSNDTDYFVSNDKSFETYETSIETPSGSGNSSDHLRPRKLLNKSIEKVGKLNEQANEKFDSKVQSVTNLKSTNTVKSFASGSSIHSGKDLKDISKQENNKFVENVNSESDAILKVTQSVYVKMNNSRMDEKSKSESKLKSNIIDDENLSDSKPSSWIGVLKEEETFPRSDTRTCSDRTKDFLNYIGNEINSKLDDTEKIDVSESRIEKNDVTNDNLIIPISNMNNDFQSSDKTAPGGDGGLLISSKLKSTSNSISGKDIKRQSETILINSDNKTVNILDENNIRATPINNNLESKNSLIGSERSTNHENELHVDLKVCKDNQLSVHDSSTMKEKSKSLNYASDAINITLLKTNSDVEVSCKKSENLEEKFPLNVSLLKNDLSLSSNLSEKLSNNNNEKETSKEISPDDVDNFQSTIIKSSTKSKTFFNDMATADNDLKMNTSEGKLMSSEKSTSLNKRSKKYKLKSSNSIEMLNKTDKSNSTKSELKNKEKIDGITINSKSLSENDNEHASFIKTKSKSKSKSLLSNQFEMNDMDYRKDNSDTIISSEYFDAKSESSLKKSNSKVVTVSNRIVNSSSLDREFSASSNKLKSSIYQAKLTTSGTNVDCRRFSETRISSEMGSIIDLKVVNNTSNTKLVVNETAFTPTAVDSCRQASGNKEDDGKTCSGGGLKFDNVDDLKRFSDTWINNDSSLSGDISKSSCKFTNQSISLNDKRQWSSASNRIIVSSISPFDTTIGKTTAFNEEYSMGSNKYGSNNIGGDGSSSNRFPNCQLMSNTLSKDDAPAGRLTCRTLSACSDEAKFVTCNSSMGKFDGKNFPSYPMNYNRRESYLDCIQIKNDDGSLIEEDECISAFDKDNSSLIQSSIMDNNYCKSSELKKHIVDSLGNMTTTPENEKAITDLKVSTTSKSFENENNGKEKTKTTSSLSIGGGDFVNNMTKNTTLIDVKSGEYFPQSDIMSLKEDTKSCQDSCCQETIIDKDLSSSMFIELESSVDTGLTTCKRNNSINMNDTKLHTTTPDVSECRSSCGDSLVESHNSILSIRRLIESVTKFTSPTIQPVSEAVAACRNADTIDSFDGPITKLSTIIEGLSETYDSDKLDEFTVTTKMSKMRMTSSKPSISSIESIMKDSVGIDDDNKSACYFPVSKSLNDLLSRCCTLNNDDTIAATTIYEKSSTFGNNKDRTLEKISSYGKFSVCSNVDEMNSSVDEKVRETCCMTDKEEEICNYSSDDKYLKETTMKSYSDDKSASCFDKVSKYLAQDEISVGSQILSVNNYTDSRDSNNQLMSIMTNYENNSYGILMTNNNRRTSVSHTEDSIEHADDKSFQDTTNTACHYNYFDDTIKDFTCSEFQKTSTFIPLKRDDSYLELSQQRSSILPTAVVSSENENYQNNMNWINSKSMTDHFATTETTLMTTSNTSKTYGNHFSNLSSTKDSTKDDYKTDDYISIASNIKPKLCSADFNKQQQLKSSKDDDDATLNSLTAYNDFKRQMKNSFPLENDGELLKNIRTDFKNITTSMKNSIEIKNEKNAQINNVCLQDSNRKNNQLALKEVKGKDKPISVEILPENLNMTRKFKQFAFDLATKYCPEYAKHFEDKMIVLPRPYKHCSSLTPVAITIKPTNSDYVFSFLDANDFKLADIEEPTKIETNKKSEEEDLKLKQIKMDRNKHMVLLDPFVCEDILAEKEEEKEKIDTAVEEVKKPPSTITIQVSNEWRKDCTMSSSLQVTHLDDDYFNIDETLKSMRRDDILTHRNDLELLIAPFDMPLIDKRSFTRRQSREKNNNSVNLSSSKINKIKEMKKPVVEQKKQAAPVVVVVRQRFMEMNILLSPLETGMLKLDDDFELKMLKSFERVGRKSTCCLLEMILGPLESFQECHFRSYQFSNSNEIRSDGILKKNLDVERNDQFKICSTEVPTPSSSSSTCSIMNKDDEKLYVKDEKSEKLKKDNRCDNVGKNKCLNKSKIFVYCCCCNCKKQRNNCNLKKNVKIEEPRVHVDLKEDEEEIDVDEEHTDVEAPEIKNQEESMHDEKLIMGIVESNEKEMDILESTKVEKLNVRDVEEAKPESEITENEEIEKNLITNSVEKEMPFTVAEPVVDDSNVPVPEDLPNINIEKEAKPLNEANDIVIKSEEIQNEEIQNEQPEVVVPDKVAHEENVTPHSGLTQEVLLNDTTTRNSPPASLNNRNENNLQTSSINEAKTISDCLEKFIFHPINNYSNKEEEGGGGGNSLKNVKDLSVSEEYQNATYLIKENSENGGCSPDQLTKNECSIMEKSILGENVQDEKEMASNFEGLPKLINEPISIEMKNEYSLEYILEKLKTTKINNAVLMEQFQKARLYLPSRQIINYVKDCLKNENSGSSV